MNTLLDTATAPIEPAQERKRARSLALAVIERIEQRIQSGALKPGDKLPSEAEIVREHGVSRTVVREAISKLQASGRVDTQHGVGTFVREPQESHRMGLSTVDVATTMDVLAMMELRVSLETESAGLAAQRRSAEHLAQMRQALDEFEAQIDQGGDTVSPDVRFHLLVAQATGNRYFLDVMRNLSSALHPRARSNTAQLAPSELVKYLHRVNQEHEQIYEGILRQDIEAARAAMRLHLSNGRERQRRALAERDAASR